MKIKIILLLLVALIFTDVVFAGTYVRGYVKRDGTYVSGHYRSTPSRLKLKNYTAQKIDNYSTPDGNPTTYKKYEASMPYKYTTNRYRYNVIK